jgi:uncharacterized protein
MERILPKSLHKRFDDPKDLIQVFVGPRQVGKTTAARGLTKDVPCIFASADTPAPPTVQMIRDCWQEARELPATNRTLVLDEIQKIPRWSEVVKAMYDEDRARGHQLRICVLGSSALLIEKGLSESLAGRFEANYFPHWTYREANLAFGATLEQFNTFGGYPKSYDFMDDAERGREYLQNSIIEPTLGRDILALHAVDKPALLRQLFWYVSKQPCRILSIQKILDYLQGSGHTDTISHYATLLAQAFLVVPIYKYSKTAHKTKKSIPKWVLPNQALIDPNVRKNAKDGFVFENLVGGHVLNLAYGKSDIQVQYVREDKREIDFIILQSLNPVLAIEVKSGRSRLRRKFMDCPVIEINHSNIEEFLSLSSIDEIITRR